MKSSESFGIARLRMFAGPNGSGKSTIKSFVGKVIGEKLFGYYVNPDEIEKTIKKTGYLNFDNFNVQIDESEAIEFFNNSALLKNAGLPAEIEKITLSENKLNFSEVAVNPYFASVVSDFIRRKLLLTNQNFTFETVMSSPDKIDFLARAHHFGYRTYLYYVATADPEINVSRVQNRVKAGGHGVPVDKIHARYYRSLNFLWEAVMHCNRAYIFDNSSDEAELIAEITNAKRIEIKTEAAPAWFKKYVLDKVVNK